MQIPRLSEPAGRLLRKVGNGRCMTTENGSLTLSYRRAGGDGLILSATFEDKPLRLWLDETQWCGWIAPMLTAPGWAMIPAELQEILAAWTLASAGACLADYDLTWPSGKKIERDHVAPAADWCLRFEQAGRRLDARILDAPLEWLDTLTDYLAPIETENTQEIRIPVALIAGWSLAGAALVQSLKPGAALLLHHAYPVANGEFGLFMNQPLAHLYADANGSYRIENVMDDFNDWPDLTPAPPAATTPATQDALLAVVVEVATLAVALSELANIKAGDVLSGATRTDGLVTLKVGARPIARGTLLDIGGRLAVKIDSLC